MHILTKYLPRSLRSDKRDLLEAYVGSKIQNINIFNKTHISLAFLTIRYRSTFSRTMCVPPGLIKYIANNINR